MLIQSCSIVSPAGHDVPCYAARDGRRLLRATRARHPRRVAARFGAETWTAGCGRRRALGARARRRGGRSRGPPDGQPTRVAGWFFAMAASAPSRSSTPPTARPRPAVLAVADCRVVARRTRPRRSPSPGRRRRLPHRR
jgi:hypothetical protein